MTALPIGEALRWLAAEAPDAPSVRDRTAALTRQELVSATEHYATLLLDEGVVPDDLVTVRLANTVEFVVACSAIWLVGATPQPLNPRLPIEEQRAVVERADSRVVVGGAPHEFPGRRVIASGRTGHTRYTGPALVAASWKAPTSSGSTGTPKIVVATAPARFDPTSRVAEFIPRHAVQLVVAPLTHSAPFTYAMRGLMTGHALVIEPRFDPSETLRVIERERITWAMLVPTMMHRMLRLPAAERAAVDLSSLESMLHIGAPCAEPTKRGWIDWIGPERVVEVYAGSESAGLTMIRGDEWLEHPGSVGRPIGGSRMRVVEPGSGEEVEASEVGLVQMRRGGAQTYRYLGAETNARDGWHSLGDLGRIDPDGYLYIIERADDLIVRGGEKVAPTTVEQALEAHPVVRSAVAFGEVDGDLGQRIVAIADVDDATVTAPEIGDWLRERAPGVIVDEIRTTTEPLRDDAGKVRRSRVWEVQ
ncbi:AMP-binding protein [Marisediminicola senii]|uniref:AMP-binding protein n=1 Tax=Marisediminicola senii TaxID=2711233 RepID=UPI0013ED7D21|nr:AMP-binding protein [Marisediminicola senii]